MKQVSVYLEQLRRLRFKLQVQNKLQIIHGNIDQVCMKFNMCDGSTYDFRGNKEIKLKTTQGNKLTYTAMFTVLNDRTPLPPLLIFKSKTPVPKTIREKYAKKALILTNSNDWCDMKIIKVWMEKIWLNLRVKKTWKPLLVLDKFAVHQNENIKDILKKGGSEVVYIPAGCTVVFSRFRIVLTE